MLFRAGLQKTGFSDKTLEEEDIAFMMLGGLYPLNKYYTVYYYISFGITLITFGGLVVKCFADGRVNDSFETAHILLIVFNMFTQMISYTYHYEIVDKLLRAIDNNFFSYGETMDENTRKIINELNEDKSARKRMYGKLYKCQVMCSAMCIMTKPLLIYAINGRNVNTVDGEDWLIHQSPISVYFPWSNYWVPYVIGHVLNYNSIFITAFTAMSSASSFIRFSEELSHQLQIVKLGFSNFMSRSHHLYRQRYGRSYLQKKGEPDNDFEKCVLTCLNKSVEHHTTITKLFEDFKKLMFVPLLTVIFDGGALVCISTVLLLTSEVTVVKVLMPPFIATELYYTYVYCSFGEQLTNHFSEIGEQVYSDNWLALSKLTKPYMIIVKAYSCYPKKLSAGGFTSPNLRSFGNVLQTAYSLLNFLVTLR